MNRIDAHAHVYSSDDVRYPTIENPIRPPGNSGSLECLKKLANENEIARICAVQPSSFYGWDNRFMCDLALAEHDNIAVICALNPEDRSSPTLVARMTEQYGIRGIRCLPTSDGHLDHPDVGNLWKACVDNDITVNVSIKRDKAHELANMLKDFPGIRCVIDHCLLLASEPDVESTLSLLLGLANFPNTFAKLSSIPENKTEDYPFSSLHEPYRRIIAAYTPGRCVWGSNFPCELWTPQSTYRQNLELFTSELGLDLPTKEEIFWNTPLKLWFGGR